jgi:hypothetical protein
MQMLVTNLDSMISRNKSRLMSAALVMLSMKVQNCLMLRVALGDAETDWEGEHSLG